MNILGERVILRAIEPEDNDMLLQMLNDPETERNLGGASFPVSSVAQKKWFETQSGTDILRCIITDRNDIRQGMGTIILSNIDRKNGTAQIHIKIAAEYRGRGYGSDAISTMVRYAFEEQRIHCVYAGVLSDNNASQKMFERCGFQKDGVLRSRVYKRGGYIDMVSYSNVASDLKYPDFGNRGGVVWSNTDSIYSICELISNLYTLSPSAKAYGK